MPWLGRLCSSDYVTPSSSGPPQARPFRLSQAFPHSRNTSPGSFVSFTPGAKAGAAGRARAVGRGWWGPRSHMYCSPLKCPWLSH